VPVNNVAKEKWTLTGLIQLSPVWPLTYQMPRPFYQTNSTHKYKKSRMAQVIERRDGQDTSRASVV